MGYGGGGRKMRSVSTQRSGLAWLYETLVSIFKDVALSPPSHFYHLRGLSLSPVFPPGNCLSTSFHVSVVVHHRALVPDSFPLSGSFVLWQGSAPWDRASCRPSPQHLL